MENCAGWRIASCGAKDPALVNEAFLRLIDYRRVGWQDRAHLFGVAAQMMRQITSKERAGPDGVDA